MRVMSPSLPEKRDKGDVEEEEVEMGRREEGRVSTALRMRESNEGRNKDGKKRMWK